MSRWLDGLPTNAQRLSMSGMQLQRDDAGGNSEILKSRSAIKSTIQNDYSVDFRVLLLADW